MPSPLLAFGVASLPMLGWLAAAAAPIVIHLWSRRKYREMPWAAMEYLLAAVKRHARRLEFEQLLLLLLRTLLVVLLVIAVAEPFLQRSGAAAAHGGRTHRVLVIDGSYSMSYKPADKTRFEAAKELARRIVEQSPQGDAFTLVLMAAPPRVVIGTPALAPAEVTQEIDGLTPVDTSFDLAATVAAVERLVVAAERELPRIEHSEVFFLTDLGRNGWLPELSAPAQAELRRRMTRLGESATIVVLDVGQAAADNLAVTSVGCAEPVVTLSQNVNFEATLKNFGRQARNRQAVELFVDGRRAARQMADVAAGGEASVAFAYQFEAPGDHVVEIRAEGDLLDVDNHRWLAIPVRQELRVLCIDGRPSGEPFHGAADYLASALAPQAAHWVGAAVRAEIAPESALSERDLSPRYDCVFLCDVAQFTAAEARILRSYLQAGGNLVFFLGEGVLADRYNRELGGGDGPQAILPAHVGKLVAQPQERIDALEFRHPMVRAFRGRGEASLLTVPVLKHFQLALTEKTAAKRVLALPGGDPLIVEGPVGRGRVVVVATSADASFTPLPLWPSYVPLVQEMLAFCVASEMRQRNLMAGELLGGALPAAVGDVAPAVLGPDSHPRAVQLQGDGGAGTWSCSDTTHAGAYTARYGPPVSRSQVYAVNCDTAESDLTPVGLDQLRHDIWPGVEIDYQTSWQDAGAAALLAPAVRPGRLSVPILYTVFALLLTETFLAWRFGHHGK